MLKIQDEDEAAPLTPTRRSRRISGGAGSAETLTPSRRSSRRASLAAAAAMTPQNTTAVTAPDGGIITGSSSKRGQECFRLFLLFIS